MRNYISACSDAIEESCEKVRDNERSATALDMLADNKPIDEIVKYSYLPKEKVLELQKIMVAKATK